MWLSCLSLSVILLWTEEIGPKNSLKNAEGEPKDVSQLAIAARSEAEARQGTRNTQYLSRSQ